VGDSFGKARVACKRARRTVPADVYQAFAAIRQRAAVEVTVKTFVLAHRRARSLPSPSPSQATAPSAVCPVACRGPDKALAVCDR
jgi:hypothetical protein